MTQRDKRVFISYRHCDVAWAMKVYDYLTQHGYDVFIDYSDIDGGGWGEDIRENIKIRPHFIVILGNRTLRRRSQAGDWLGREIELALDTKRNIVPLLVENFSFNWKSSQEVGIQNSVKKT